MEWLVIGISGVTCGGKTTLAHSLLEYLQSHHNLTLWPKPYKVGIVRMVSQDNYFLPVQDERHQWLEQINAINFELLTSLDMKQMLIDISWLMCGNLVQDQKQQQQQNDFEMLHNQQQQQQQKTLLQQQHAYYNNNNYHSSSSSSCSNSKNNKTSHHHHQQQQHKLYHEQTNLLVDQNIEIINVLIIEGFIIFNQPDLYKLCNIKYHFHLPYEKCFERRQKRTYDPPDVTGYFELCVWPHYEKSLAEYRHHKDIIYLNGEIERERIFKYVLKQISTYFDESKIFTNPSTSLSAAAAAAMLPTTKSMPTLSTATTTTNVPQINQGTILNLNLRMLRHQQPLMLFQQQQQYQQHSQEQQQLQEQQQQLFTTALH